MTIVLNGTPIEQTTKLPELNGTELYPIGGRGLYHVTTEQVKNYILAYFAKSSINLEEVDNTSDLDKPISNATQAALDDKLSKGSLYVSSLNGKIGDITLLPSDVNLEKVNNTADIDKPVSNATRLELVKKLDIATFQEYKQYISNINSIVDSTLLHQGNKITTNALDIEVLMQKGVVTEQQIANLTNIINANFEMLSSGLTPLQLEALKVYLETNTDTFVLTIDAIDAHLAGYKQSVMTLLNQLRNDLTDTNTTLTQLSSTTDLNYHTVLGRIESLNASINDLFAADITTNADMQARINQIISDIEAFKLQTDLSIQNASVYYVKDLVDFQQTVNAAYDYLLSLIRKLQVGLGSVSDGIDNSIKDYETLVGEYEDLRDSILKQVEDIKNEAQAQAEREKAELQAAIDAVSGSITDVLSVSEGLIESQITVIRDEVTQRVNEAYERLDLIIIDTTTQIDQMLADAQKLIQDTQAAVTEEINKIVSDATLKIDQLLADSKESIKQLEAQLTQDVERIQGIVDATNATVEDLRTNLTSRVEAAEATLAGLNLKLEADLTALNNRVTESETKLNTLNTQLESSVADMNSRVNQAENKVTELDTKLTADVLGLNTRLDQSETTVSGLKTDLTNLSLGLDVDLKNLSDRITVNKDTITDLSANLTLTVDGIKTDISNINTNVDAVRDNLAAETLKIDNQIKAETADRLASIALLNDGLTSEIQSRKDGDLATTTAINNYKASNDKALANVQDQVTVLVTDTAAMATAVTALDARLTISEGDSSEAKTLAASAVDKATIALTESSAAVSKVSSIEASIDTINGALGNKVDVIAFNQLKTDVTNVNGRVTANTSDITSIKSNITDLDKGIESNTSAISALKAIQDIQEGKITQVVSDTTSLTNQLATVQGDLITKVDSAAFNELKSTVTKQGESITSQSSDITQLKDSVSTINGTLSTKADSSALSALQSRVDVTENSIIAQAKDITSLTSSVNNKNRTYRQTTAPTTDLVIGDIWVNTTVGQNNKQTRWDGVAWIDLTDPRISSSASAIESLTTEVKQQGTNISSVSNSVTALENKLEILDGKFDGVASAEAVSNLQSSVSRIDGVLTTQSTDITRLTNDLVTTNNNVNTKASSESVTALDSKITEVDGRVSTNSTNITNLTGRVTTTEGALITKASVEALDALTTRVTNTESGVTTQAERITSLTASVNNKNRTYRQATAPTTGIVVGDIWINTTAGQNNKQSRWDGTAWVDLTDPRTATNATAITGLQATVTQQGKDISSQSTSITDLGNSIETLDGKVATKAESAAVSSLSSRVDTIDGKVSSQSTDITRLTNSLENLNVGGVNLQSNSHFDKVAEYNGWNSYYSTKSINASNLVAKITSVNSTARVEKVIPATSGLKLNTEYTLSVFIKSPVIPEFRGYVNAALVSQKLIDTFVANEYIRVSTTFKITAFPATIRLYTPSAAINTLVYLEWEKLEVGNKATDWSPATVDIATSEAIQTLSSTVTQQGKDITSQGTSITNLTNELTTLTGTVSTKASADAFNALDSKVSVIGGKVTSNTTSITNLTGRVSTVEGNVTKKLDASIINDYSTTIDTNKAIADNIASYNANLIIGGYNMFRNSRFIVTNGTVPSYWTVGIGAALASSATVVFNNEVAVITCNNAGGITDISLKQRVTDIEKVPLSISCTANFISGDCNISYTFKYVYTDGTVSSGQITTATLVGDRYQNDLTLTPDNTKTVKEFEIWVSAKPKVVGDSFVVELSKPQLEKGHATAWTESPRDVKDRTDVNASAISSIGSRVSTAEGNITSQSNSITSLENRVTKTEGSLSTKAESAAVTNLTSEVSTLKGTVTSQGTDITKLNNSLTTLTKTVSGKADSSALSALDSKVTTIDGTVTSQGTDITKLNNSLANFNIGGTNLQANSHFDLSDQYNGWESYYSTKSINASNLVVKYTSVNASSRIEKVITATAGYKLNTEYTLSVFIKSPIKPELRSFVNTTLVSQTSDTFVANEYLKMSVTFTMSAFPATIRFYTPNAAINSTLYIEWEKLEVGNKATDWSPATVDLASAAALQSLSTTVTQQGKDITSQGTSITNLNNSLATTNANLNKKADATALTALDNKVTKTNEGLETQSTNLVNLTNSLSSTIFNQVILNSASEGIVSYLPVGELTKVADTTSTAGRVIRLGDNTGNDIIWIHAPSFIPFDPNRLYKLKFRLRRVSGDGSLYVGVACKNAEQSLYITTANATSTSMSSSTYLYVNQKPALGEWQEYEYFISGRTEGAASGNGLTTSTPLKLAALAAYFTPMLIANYPSATGIVELDYVMIEPADVYPMLEANATATNNLTSKVSNLEGSVSSQSTSITKLTNRLDVQTTNSINILANSNISSTYDGVAYPFATFAVGEDWVVGTKYTLIYCAEHKRGPSDTTSILTAYAGGGNQSVNSFPVNGDKQVITQVFTKNSRGVLKGFNFYTLNKPTSATKAVLYWAVLLRGDTEVVDSWIPSPYDFTKSVQAQSDATQALDSKVTTIDGKVTTNTTAITNLTGRVSTVEGNVAKKLDASIINDYSTTVDTSKAIADNIASYNANLVIGGANLLRNTGESVINQSYWGTGVGSGNTGNQVIQDDGFFSEILSSTGRSDVSWKQTFTCTIKPGESITISADIISTGNVNVKFLLVPTYSGTGVGTSFVSPNLSNGRQSFTAKNETTGTIVSMLLWMAIYPKAAGNVGTVFFYRPMAEIATRASNWTRNATEITSLLDANATAISSIGSRVSTAEGNITSQSKSITSLANRVDKTETAISTKAESAAVSNLTSEVNTLKGTVTSQSTSITKLSNRLDTQTTNTINLLANSNVVGEYNGTGYPHVSYTLGEDWEVGKKYTIIFCAEHKRASGDTTSILTAYAGGGSQTVKSFPIDGDKQVVSRVFTKNSTGIGRAVNFYLIGRTITTTVATVYWAVLLRGDTEVVDVWVPSPFDYLSSAKAQSDATQALDSKVTTIDGKVTTNTNSITSLTGRVATTENNIKTKADSSALLNYYTKTQADSAIAGQITAYNATLSTANGKNSIENSGFTEKTNGWISTGTAAAIAAFTISNSSGAMKVVANNAAKGYIEIRANSDKYITVETNRTYRIACRYRADAATMINTSYHKLRVSNSAGYVTAVDFSASATLAWTNVSVEYTTTNTEPLKVGIMLCFVSGTVYIDDVEFIDVTDGKAIDVNAAAISSLNTTVTKQGKDITSASDSITDLKNSVGVLNTEVNKKADATAFNALNTKVTTMDGTLSSQSNDITKLTNNLANLSVGGTNLQSNSHFDKTGEFNGWVSYYGTHTIMNSKLARTSNAVNPAARTEKVIDAAYGLKLKTEYTLTLFYKSPVKIEWRGFVNATIVSITEDTFVTTDYVRTSVTFTATAFPITLRAYMPNVVVGNATYFEWEKLEIGNKPTDWSPASSDVASSEALSALTSTVTQQGKNITSQGTSITNLNNSLATTNANVSKKAEASALTALDNIVTSTVEGLATQSSNLVNLTNSLSSMSNNYVTLNSATEGFVTFNATGEITKTLNATGNAGRVITLGNNNGNDNVWLHPPAFLPFEPSRLYRLRARLRRVSGAGSVYVGIACKNASQSSYVTTTNTTSANMGSAVYLYTNQRPALGEWQEVEYFISGVATNEATGSGNTLKDPKKLPNLAAFVTPLFIANYASEAGVVELDYVTIEQADDYSLIDANATATSNLTTRLNTLDGTVTSQSTDITKLTNRLNVQAANTVNILANSNVTGNYVHPAYPHVSYVLGEDWEVGSKYTIIFCAEHTRATGDTTSVLSVYAGGGLQTVRAFPVNGNKQIVKKTFTKNASGTGKAINFYLLTNTTAATTATVYWAVLLRGDTETVDSWIPSPYDYISSVSATTTAIQTLDSKVTTIDGKVTTNTNSITSLTGRVSTVEGNVAKKLDATVINNYFTKTEANSAAAGQIAEYAANLSIGGQNLLAGTKADGFVTYNANATIAQSNGNFNTSTYRITTVNTAAGGMVPIVKNRTVSVRKGVTYVLSFYAMGSMQPNYLYLMGATSSGSNLASVAIIPASYSSTVASKVTATFTSGIDSSTVYVLIGNTGNTGWMDISEVMLQEGTKDTAWTEALLDVNTRADATATAVNTISGTVTKMGNTVDSHTTSITSLNGSITTINGTLNSKADGSALNTLTNRVTTAEGTISNHSSDLTKLNNSITTINGTLSNKADSSTVSALTNTVTKQGETLTATGKDITTINATLTDTTSVADTANTLAQYQGQGKLVRNDPTFTTGYNNLAMYANGASVHTMLRQTKSSDNPSTSTHEVLLTFTGDMNLSNYGVHPNLTSAPNKVFLLKTVIRMPVGIYMHQASNGVGDGSIQRWLTSVEGTGRYETYYRLVRCGATGTFSSTGHIAFKRASSYAVPTEAKPTLVYISQYAIFDVTEAPDTVPKDLTEQVSANASALSTLTSTVTQQGKDITSQSTSITNLTAGLATANGNIAKKVESSAFNVLDIKVTNIDGRVGTNSTAITNLTGRMNTAEGNIAKKLDASVITAYSTTVDTNKAISQGIESYDATLTIGGSNLLRNTGETVTNQSYWGTGVGSGNTGTQTIQNNGFYSSITASTATNDLSWKQTTYVVVKPDESVTLSVDITLTGNVTARLIIVPLYSTGTGGSNGSPNISTNGRASYTFKNNSTANTTGFTIWLAIYPKAAGNRGTGFFTKPMFEVASKASNWSRNAAEVTSDLAANAKAITDTTASVATLDTTVKAQSKSFTDLKADLESSATAVTNLLGNSNVETPYVRPLYPHVTYKMDVEWEVGAVYTLMYCAEHKRASGDTTSVLSAYAGGGNQAIRNFPINGAKQIITQTFTKNSKGTGKAVNFYLLANSVAATVATVYWAVLVKGSRLYSNEWFPGTADFLGTTNGLAVAQQAIQADVTAIDGKVSAQSTTMTNLTTRVTDAEKGLALKADSSVLGGYYTKTQADSAIAGQVNSYDASLSIGGDNLLLNTGPTLTAGTPWYTGAVTAVTATFNVTNNKFNTVVSASTAVSNASWKQDVYTTLYPDQSVTFSAIVETLPSTLQARLMVRIYYTDGNNDSYYSTQGYITSTGPTSLTATVPSNKIGSRLHVWLATYPRAAGGTGTVSFTKPMLELSSKASAWSQNMGEVTDAIKANASAISDITTRVDKTENGITTNASAITSLATNANAENLIAPSSASEVSGALYQQGSFPLKAPITLALDDQFTIRCSISFEHTNLPSNAGLYAYLEGAPSFPLMLKPGKNQMYEASLTVAAAMVGRVINNVKLFLLPSGTANSTTKTTWHWAELTRGNNLKASSSAVALLESAVEQNGKDISTVNKDVVLLGSNLDIVQDVITVQDTRSVNSPPNYYWTKYPRRVVNEFKQSTVMGVSGYGKYVNVTTTVPWTDSSGGAIQQMLSNGNPSIDAYRYSSGSGTSATWTAWGQPIKELQTAVGLKADTTAVNQLKTDLTNVDNKVIAQASSLTEVEANLNSVKSYLVATHRNGSVESGGMTRGVYTSKKVLVAGLARGLNLITWDSSGNPVSNTSYDSYVSDANSTNLAAAINALSTSLYFTVIGTDNIGAAASNTALQTAITNAGGSVAYWSSMSSAVMPIFTGKRGMTSGTGLQHLFSGVGTGASTIYTLEFVGGVPKGLSGDQVIDESKFAKAGAVQLLEAKVDDNYTAVSKSITDLTSTVGKHTSTLQVQAKVLNGVQANYLVKMNTNNTIAGFGLVQESTALGSVISTFGVVADNFYIGDPASSKKPFIVTTTSKVVNGITYPAGTWIDSAFIANATIGTAKIADAAITSAKIGYAEIKASNIGALAVENAAIANAAITDAKVLNLSAAKLTTGILSADRIAANSITAGKLNVTSLSAVSATIGTLRTATTGARVEISDNLIQVFDANNKVRVKLGVF